MSRGQDAAPIWARPEPGGRRPRLSREAIAAAALDVADRDGFDALTMRRLAAELGVGTMTLYRYVRNKDELVALMHDRLMAESLVPEGELPTDWRAALGAVARRTRAVVLRHPWTLLAFQEAQFGPNAMRHFEQSLAAVAGMSLDPAGKFELLSLVDDYVIGNVLHASEARTRARLAAESPDLVRAAVEFGMRQLESGAFPHTAALLRTAAPGGQGTPGPVMDERGLDEQFERGLAAVLDGVAARLGIGPADARLGGTHAPTSRARSDGAGGAPAV